MNLVACESNSDHTTRRLQDELISAFAKIFEYNHGSRSYSRSEPGYVEGAILLDPTQESLSNLTALDH